MSCCLLNKNKYVGRITVREYDLIFDFPRWFASVRVLQATSVAETYLVTEPQSVINNCTVLFASTDECNTTQRSTERQGLIVREPDFFNHDDNPSDAIKLTI